MTANVQLFSQFLRRSIHTCTKQDPDDADAWGDDWQVAFTSHISKTITILKRESVSTYPYVQ